MSLRIFELPYLTASWMFGIEWRVRQRAYDEAIGRLNVAWPTMTHAQKRTFAKNDPQIKKLRRCARHSFIETVILDGAIITFISYLIAYWRS